MGLSSFEQGIALVIKKLYFGGAWLAQWRVQLYHEVVGSRGCGFRPQVGCSDYLKIKS